MYRNMWNDTGGEKVVSVIDLSEQDIPFESAQSIGGRSSRTQKDDKI